MTTETEREMRRTGSVSAEVAERDGYTIDRHTYPWTAYKGPRFAPTEEFGIRTPAWPNEADQ